MAAPLLFPIRSVPLQLKTLITVDTNETYPDFIKTYNKDSQTVSQDTTNPKAGKPVPFHYEFIMQPIDEPRLEINADTRDIDIPTGFKKLVGV